MIRDFHDVSWAPSVLKKCVVVGDCRGDQIGAQRVLNDDFHETLVALDDLDQIMKYQLVKGPSPVSPQEVRDFLAVVRVRPITASGSVLVEWSASWEASDDTACDFAGGIYAALLAELENALA
jgi:hypothetical protein